MAFETVRFWSVALMLSALIHCGALGVLLGRSWAVRHFVFTDPVVVVLKLIEPTPRPVAREERRPIPSPARASPKKTPPPPLVESKSMPMPALPEQEAAKGADPIIDAPSTPPPPDPPLASSRTASRPMPAVPARKEPETSSGGGPAVDEIAKSLTGDASALGSSSPAPTVAGVPRVGAGSSVSTSTSGTSLGTSGQGVTQWAHPQGGYQVHPSYPASARRLGIQGTVQLKVHVMADGRVGEVIVERSAGHADLDRAATDAVRQWHFEPARKGSEPVATWVLLPVQFQLR